MATQDTIIIGTRASALALKQAAMVQAAILAHAGFAQHAITTQTITTTGDTVTEKPLYDIGGKALFCKEIDQALLAGHVDIAVHSLKDVPTDHPEELILAAVLPRDDPRDALLYKGNFSVDNRLWSAHVGTSAMRRQAQLLHHYPHLQISPMRGNITTRALRWQEGQFDAIVLAMAGLVRLNMTHLVRHVFDTNHIIPAACQGIIGIYCHKDNTKLRQQLAAHNHAPTLQCALAERALLRRLDGSCRTPIGAYATIEGDSLTLSGCLASTDGHTLYKTSVKGNARDAEHLGDTAGCNLIKQAGSTYQQLIAE